MTAASARMMAITAAMWVAAAASTAVAQRGSDAAPSTPGALRDAARAVEAGDYQRAVILVKPLLAVGRSGSVAARLDTQDRAEAFRIYGLASFFLDRPAEAEYGFLEYLKLDVDGRLDPALVPPEAVVFFEDVRSRHAAELRTYRPKPKRRSSWALNLIPPAGQFQNREPGKGWTIATAGVLLLATHLGSFYVLNEWCNTSTGICRADGQSRTDAARTVQALNLMSGAVLIGLVGYGIVDGFINYRKHPDRGVSMGLAPGPSPTTGQVFVRGTF